MFDAYVQPVMDFVRANPNWAVVIFFLMAFGECFALVSLFVPAIAFFTAFGVMAGAAGLSLTPLVIAAALGAATGFWASFEIGRWAGPTIAHHWPFRDHPVALEKAHRFFEKWGVPGIFLGHFFGPVRAFIAVVAGVAGMPLLAFHAANCAASVIWAVVVLYLSSTVGAYLDVAYAWLVTAWSAIARNLGF